jgi:hypothetical protein
MEISHVNQKEMYHAMSAIQHLHAVVFNNVSLVLGIEEEELENVKERNGFMIRWL